MPSVMSTCDRMQFTHMLEGLGRMLVPHKQHKLQTSSNMGQESRAACPVGSQNQAQSDTAGMVCGELEEEQLN